MNVTKDCPPFVLDPSGENTAQEGYRQVSNDIEFLRYDSPDSRLWITGRALCQWVQDLYKARQLQQNRDFTVLQSPKQQLREVLGPVAD